MAAAELIPCTTARCNPTHQSAIKSLPHPHPFHLVLTHGQSRMSQSQPVHGSPPLGQEPSPSPIASLVDLLKRHHPFPTKVRYTNAELRKPTDIKESSKRLLQDAVHLFSFHPTLLSQLQPHLERFAASLHHYLASTAADPRLLERLGDEIEIDTSRAK